MNLRRVSIFSLLFVFCVLSYSSSAQAFRDRCPRHEVKTELVAKRDKTRFRRISIKSINEYLNNHMGTVLAFVQYNPLDVTNEYEFETVDIGGGWLCVKLTSVKSYFRVSPTITMPTDFKKSSCEYKIILTHEKRHLKEVYDYHKENTGGFRRFLGVIARDVPIYKPVRTAQEISMTQSKIGNYFQGKYAELLIGAYEELDKAQRKIDSPQEYLFIGRRMDRCGKEENQPSNRKSFPDHSLE